ncbi:hypothetical protein D3C85_1191580 [compost metagenome]
MAKFQPEPDPISDPLHIYMGKNILYNSKNGIMLIVAIFYLSIENQDKQVRLQIEALLLFHHDLHNDLNPEIYFQ